jgi:putative methyltransferase (TIGR04325 family)
MDVSATLHGMIDGLLDLPGIRLWRIGKYDRRFANAERVNLFRGIYPSADAAAADIPASKPNGYDHEAPAAMYDDRTRQIYPSDYPILFWMQKLFADGCKRVFDIGGHIGVGYYAYQQYLKFPADLHWNVSDVPAVVAQGRKLAEQRDKAGHLSFTSELTDIGDAEILFASGSIQYLPPTLAELLKQADRRPRHLLINLLPLHESAAYFTVQNIGTAFCVYRIEMHSRFLGDLRALGYEVRDHWENLEKRCDIPFAPPHFSLDRYHGFYLTLRN